MLRVQSLPVCAGARRLLQTNVGTSTGFNAYDAADIVATISSTSQSSALDLGAWATNNTNGMATCTRSKGYEVTFIQLNETVASVAGAQAMANQTLFPTTGVTAILKVCPHPPSRFCQESTLTCKRNLLCCFGLGWMPLVLIICWLRQVSGPNVLPFSTAKQTLLLAFLNSALPPSSSGLSAMGITSVVQDYKSAAANVSLAALVNSNHEAFESQLNSSSVLTNVDQQFTLSNLTGYTVSVLSMAAAPQLSIASQVS